MNTTDLKNCITAILIVATMSLTANAADDHSKLLDDYLTDDVVAVIYIDVNEIKPTEIAKQLSKTVLLQSASENIAAFARAAEPEFKKLIDAGVEKIYVLVRMSDIANQGTSFVIPVVEGKSSRDAMAVLKQILAQTPLSQFAKEFQIDDGVVLSAGNARQLKRLAEKRPELPRDLGEAFDTLGSGLAGLILFGDADSRQVLGEVVPNLPQPFESLTGKFVAEKLKWGGVKLDEALNVNLEIEASDSAAAALVVDALETSIKQMTAHQDFQASLSDEQQQLIADALQPKSNGARVSVSLSGESVLTSLATPIQKVRQAARETADMNTLRQLTLALHNYESAHKRFPRYDGKSGDQPAGLSWRVHVLPFVEQNELYKQFKLNEPWDSEHNIKLVEQMPRIFRCEIPEYDDVNAEGKTAFLIPFANEAIFQPTDEEGIQFADMPDGSSNTILLVRAAPESSAVWTQPDDWEVDLKDPWKGFKVEGRKFGLAAFADGSVRQLQYTNSPTTLRALITRDGGEVAEVLD